LNVQVSDGEFFKFSYLLLIHRRLSKGPILLITLANECYRLQTTVRSQVFQTHATETKSYRYAAIIFELPNQVLFPQQAFTQLDNQISRANMRYRQHVTYTGRITPRNIYSSLDELNVYE